MFDQIGAFFQTVFGGQAARPAQEMIMSSKAPETMIMSSKLSHQQAGNQMLGGFLGFHFMMPYPMLSNVTPLNNATPLSKVTPLTQVAPLTATTPLIGNAGAGFVQASRVTTTSPFTMPIGNNFAHQSLPQVQPGGRGSGRPGPSRAVSG